MAKRGVFLALTLLLLATATAAFGQLAEDIQKHPNCPYCGMDRQMFAHSRMLIEYDDGSAFGACSLHCAAVDLALRLDKNPKSIQVADYNTKKLIDAEKAVWVMGGSKPGVMTKRAKWAFADPKAAQAFIQENQGQLATFDDVMKAAYEDMYADTKMIRDKRAKMKQMKQGEHK
jgi:copper chaperone NosL